MYKQLIDKVRGRLSAPLHVKRGLGWLCLFLCVQTYVSANTSFPSIQGGARGGSPTGALILHSPQDYQVKSISSNGKWACGVYVNMSNLCYAFRWDLTTGETLLLSGDNCQSDGLAVSNEGVVAGMYDNAEATDNGAPAYTAGYWKDGRWHHLPNIGNAPVTNNEEVGYANAISANGTFIGGCYNDKNSFCIPLIWKDGKVAHTFETAGCEGMIYAVSEDGQKAAGWSITPNSEQARVATVWEVGKGATYIMDERMSDAWCSGRKFSPGGRYLLYWEEFYDIPADQITDPAASNMVLRAIYDMETGEKSDIPTITRDPFNFDVFDITDSGTVVGYESPEVTQLDQAIIFKDGKTHWLYDYLQERGVDLDADTCILRNGADTYFIRGVGISNDEKTYAVLYYDPEGALSSMVIKLDENLVTREPVGLKVRESAGAQAATVSWKTPLAGAGGVTGYNVYRNGVRLNETPVTALSYFDRQASYGTNSYHVTALYGTEESVPSQSVALEISEPVVQSPRALFARQMGYNDALLCWERPASNLTFKAYYEEDAAVTGFGGANNSFEAAVRFSSEELSVYPGQSIRRVSFYPMTPQEQWTVNIYSNPIGGGEKQLLYTQLVTQPLTYGKENVVTLHQPVPLPDDADLLVAVAVTVPSDYSGYNVLGEVSGNPVPGSSDLLRMLTEPDFYSLYDEGQKFGATQLTSWAIGVMLSADAEKADEADLVSHYNVYDGEEKVGETENCSFRFPTLSDGEHTLGVQAVYADGRLSAIRTAPLAVAADGSVYRAVSEVSVSQQEDGAVRFAWDEPVDDDETFITYCTDVLQSGVLGPVANNYNYIAAAVYDSEKMRGYEGYLVHGFRFYPLTTAVFTFFLEEDGVVVAEAGVDTYTAGMWNTVHLAEPVTVKPGSTYRLLLDCYDVTPETAPLGLDARMPFVEKGDLYSITEGVTYVSVGQASAFGNWMMGLVAASPDSKQLPIEGYTVRIDGKSVTDAPLVEPAFTYHFPEGYATHRLNVDVCYTEYGKVPGSAVFFSVGTNAVDASSVAGLRVVQADGYVRVDGGEVLSMTAVATDGQTVARAEGNLLPVAALPQGICLLHIRLPHQFVVAKVRIVK